MELRGCSHLHFISAIRGGEVIKVPNLSREKKVLKFKNVLEIYACSDSISHDFLTKKPPRVDRSLATPYGYDKVKTKIKIESMEEESDHDLCTMTLKQLKDTCKSKKRKIRSVSFTAVKQEHNDLQHEEDEIELKETIGSWKRKLFKKRKAKRNSTTKRASISSKTNNLRGRTKDIPSDLALNETSREIFKSGRIKVEDSEPTYLQPQAIGCILRDDTENVSSVILGAVSSSFSKQSIKTTLDDSGCLSGTSCELLEQPIPISVETQSCSLNQVSCEFEETQSWSPSQVKSPLNSEDSKIENVIQLGDIAVPGDQSELRKVEGMTDLMACDEALETVVLGCASSDALLVPPCIDKSVEVQGPGTVRTNNFQNVEFLGNGKPSGFIDNKSLEAEVMKTLGGCSSTVTSDKCLPSTNDVAPRDTRTCAVRTCAVEDTQLSKLDVSVASLTCSLDTQPSIAVDEVTGSTTSESYQDKKVVHPPERLFSARKTISPNSQQKLCRAMNSIDLRDDTKINCSTEKLAFEKDCEDRWSDIKRDQNISKRPEAFDSAEITTNSRQLTRKGKDDRKGLRSKGFVKGPRPSHISQHAASGCSSVQSCSQNAIKFSQQQMHDIERLAMKLVTELQSMKEIVVDSLQCESKAGAKLRYNTDEARVAVENATKVEETTRKWLSIMTRDCNRFCKIMTLSEANAAFPEASPEKAVHKERKKIMFADEAGGRLCHVRVFEAPEAGMGVASLVESQITKDETLSE